jgi:type I restriction enzyme S subunit
MKDSWVELTLDDVCSKITDGSHHSPKSVNVGKPMGSVKDMTPFGLNLKTSRLISNGDFDKLVKQGCKPAVNDVLISKDGNSALDTVCRIRKPINAVLLSSVAILRPDTEVIEPEFLRLYLDAEPTRQYLKATSISGAAIPRVILKDFKRAKIILPSCLNHQKLISNYISNYDNLIENNNRRIAILEDMAQSLYREWFVNFRYPGHADAVDKDGNQKLIDSPLGKIPVDWVVKSAAEAININPSTKLTKDGEKPFVGMSGLSEGSMVIGDIIEKTGNSGAKFINRDTLFARITPCLQNGKTGFVQFLTPEQPIGFGSTEFIVLRESKYLSSEFIYLLSRSNNFREHAIQSMTGATGRQRVHNDCFASYYLTVPPKELMNEFTQMVQPMFKSIFNLSKRNQNLKQQRDMLLPKLISGQIEL